MNKQRIIAAMAAAVALVTVCDVASATPVTLYAWYQRSSGGVLSSLMFKAGAAQGCPNNGAGYMQPCYNPAQGGAGVGWTSINNVVPIISGAATPTFDWNGTTLTETGLFWAASFISSNPNGNPVISDKVTSFSLNTATQTVTAVNYECIEGGFLRTVGANGCKNVHYAGDGWDESPTFWQVGGNPYCVSQVIEGASRVITYDTQTANFKPGDTVTGGTSGATATIGADTDLGANGALGLTGISGTFVSGELLTGSPNGGSANSTSVATAIADDYSLADGGMNGTMGYNSQTGNFTLTAAIHGSVTAAKGNIVADADGGATGTLTLQNVTNGAGTGFANFSTGEIITDGLGGSATVTAPATLAFSIGTPIPRGPYAVALHAQGASCEQTSGAFDNFTIVQDDAGVLILSNTAAIGTCKLFGTGPTSACPVDLALASNSYFVFFKPGASDWDADSIPDTIDNCPHVANANQLDTDGNGVGNVCQAGVDFDADGINNELDNCVLVANNAVTAGGGPQLDTNGDLYGNRCDPDITNDGVVNINDLNKMKNRLTFVPLDHEADLTLDGVININDINLLKSFLTYGHPGPSGLKPLCPPTCP